MTFQLCGRKYEVNPNEIERRMKGITPDHRDNMRYFVEIENHQYPIKQVISVISGLPPAAFSSQMAYALLDRMGLKIHAA